MTTEPGQSDYSASHRTQDQAAFRQVSLTGCILCIFFATLFALSGPFEYGNLTGRPIVLVTAIFFVATLLSLWGIKAGAKIVHSRRSLTWMIVLFGLSFRLIMVFSQPILEIDYYRYMWDGKVSNSGVSPFRFSPWQALHDDPAISDADLAKVVALAQNTQSLHTIVSRVHFEEYTTIYPPVSQAVFAFTMRLVPDRSSVEAYLFAIKAALVVFDIGTMLLMLVLLRRTHKHPAWLIAYAWNPLVIKEIANSGHLDSIAVFFLTAAFCAVTCLLYKRSDDTPKNNCCGLSLRPLMLVAAAAVMLALGTGAKLFPVILFPAMLLVISKSGWRYAALFGGVFATVVALVMWPMAVENARVRSLSNQPTNSENDLKDTNVARNGSVNQKEGLSGFLTRWRMNDTVFSVIYENAKPDSGKQKDRAWYVFVPDESRRAWNDWLKRHFAGGGSPAFLTARVVTLSMFAVAYLLILLRIRRSLNSGLPDPESILSSLFLVMPVFLVLQPTQNPWYWLWAMPLICFARNRGWLFVSAFLFLYYLRFWFKTLEGEYWLGSFCYSGLGLFDYCFVWLEFGFILAGLIWFRFRPKCRAK